ncbi:MAG: phage tail sheath family protein [Bacteroidetes bacterium]|nr:phage tail sheath family protein [Bacteroidota bacterium]
MADYKTPGVYIEEIPKLPPSIASVETAIPAFIGYTETAPDETEPGSTVKKPVKISSIFEYEQFFCTPNLAAPAPHETDIVVSIDLSKSSPTTVKKTKNMPTFMMYYALQMFFKNGGGDCYIVSVDTYPAAGGTPDRAKLEAGLTEIEKLFDVTLIVFPDAMSLTKDNYYGLHNLAIQQCANLKDRFTVLDVWIDDTAVAAGNPPHDNVGDLRNANLVQDPANLKYAAVYYPRIYVDLDFVYADADVKLTVKDTTGATIFDGNMADAKTKSNSAYTMAQRAIADYTILLPVSAAAVGVYAAVDSSRGVWKAPANVSIISAIKPEVSITNDQQKTLNVDANAGKSINVIRSFPGRGPAFIWGARTLAGNDNEWRYISVRRFFIMVETSVKNAADQFVFEPNDENTWTRIKAMIENFLTQQWKAGALMGASTKEAFFVHIGLGQTMTELDIWEGRMIIQIGLAAVRPAEFIILQFMHKMLAEN